MRVFPAETKLACEIADMVFMNEKETNLLGPEAAANFHKPYIVKHAARGAEWGDVVRAIRVFAPEAVPTDTPGAGDI